jgi:hypothetical protein
MLIEFRVANHRSILDEQALTFEAATIGAKDDPRVRTIGSRRLLPALALYGGNASGKSNVLTALGFMRDAVDLSCRSWAPNEGVPREPFAWGAGPGQPSTFEVTLLLATGRVQYGFVVDDARVLEEWIYAWPSGRKQTWLTREGDKLKFSEHLSGPNQMIQVFLNGRPNALSLSAAAQLGHEQLMPLYRALMNIRVADLGSGAPRTQAPETPLYLALIQERSHVGAEQRGPLMNGLRGLLQAADSGIVDVKLEEKEWVPLRSGLVPGKHFRLFFQHQAADAAAWLPLEAESGGTKTLVRIAPALLNVLATGGVLVVDELGADLHSLLVTHLLRQFQDPSLNPHNAQLLFATHDTNLLGTTLGEPALRRDQVWLTEKRPDGATCVYPLTDYKPRDSENLERGYLQGRYGAVPMLGALLPVEA